MNYNWFVCTYCFVALFNSKLRAEKQFLTDFIGIEVFIDE